VRTNDEKNFEKSVKKGLEIAKKEAIKMKRCLNIEVKSVRFLGRGGGFMGIKFMLVFIGLTQRNSNSHALSSYILLEWIFKS